MTFFKDAYKNIIKRFVAWFSIVTIMMIGTSGFLGLNSTAFSMKNTAEEYFEKYNLNDLEMYSTAGVSEEELELIRSQDNVRDVEGTIEIGASVRRKDSSDQGELFTISTMNKRVNIPLISDGKQPKEPYECALCPDLMEKLGLTLGDTVIIERDTATPEYVIRDGEYIVTGVVDMPQYVTRDITKYGVFPDEAVNAPGLGNDHTKAYIDLLIPEGIGSLDEGYNEAVAGMMHDFEGLSDELTLMEEDRIEEVKSEALKDGYEVPEFPEVKWHVTGRNINNCFLGFLSSYDVLNSVSAYFDPLFILIAFMVVFSTITIIVEDQKTEIGAMKALGISDGRIRAKYLLFGLTSTVLGIALGIPGAVIIEKIMNSQLAGMYVFGELPILIDWKVAEGIAVSFILFAAIITFVSCNTLVRCSAVGLMNGSEPSSRLGGKNKKASRKGKGLYFGLVLRNISSDLPRVIVSVVIVFESVLMIGMSFSLSMGIKGAVRSQTGDIWKYGIVIVTGGDDDTMKSTGEAIDKLGYKNISLHADSLELKRTDNSAASKVFLYAAENADDTFSDFYRLFNSEGEETGLPSEGILITEGVREELVLNNGDSVMLVSSRLDSGNSSVIEVVKNYIGKYVFCSKEGYEKIFGKEAADNSFFVACDPSDKKVREALKDIKGIRTIESTYEQIEFYDQLMLLFDILVGVIIFMVIILAFMIQLNLCNIQVSRRKKDILVMRVNGFSMGQIVGYLSGEAVMILILGIITGVICGIPFTNAMIDEVEISDFMFVSGPFLKAWLISGTLCSLFSLVIYGIAYSRIRFMAVTNINT